MQPLCGTSHTRHTWGLADVSLLVRLCGTPPVLPAIAEQAAETVLLWMDTVSASAMNREGQSLPGARPVPGREAERCCPGAGGNCGDDG